MNLEQTTSEFPQAIGSIYDNFIKIKENSVVVVGDMEIPNVDLEILAMACELGFRLRIQSLILNGDIVDGAAFSKWSKTSTPSHSFSDEINMLKDTLKSFTKYFSKIYVISGNHDRRLSAATGGQLTIPMLLSDIPGVMVSDYSYLEITTPMGRWLVNHPQSYSRVPLSTGREIAAIHHANILCGHNHHLACGRDKSGKYYVVDGGCARNPLMTEYKSLNINTFPAWNPGFTIIKDGVPLIINKQNFNTIWELL